MSRSNHRGTPSRTPCSSGLPMWRAFWAPPNQHRVQQAVVGRRPALPILGTGFATIDGNGCRTQLSREPRLGGPVRRRAGCRRRAGAVDLPPVGRCRAAVSWNTSSWRTASSWNTAST
ncbi:uncharacterized protein [Lolium perenne]|uniref:uncharacterized protein isoform X4 n=1 Tax=Lolium perenne TaxID=4522 RepID=UPI003A98D1F3